MTRRELQAKMGADGGKEEERGFWLREICGSAFGGEDSKDSVQDECF